MFRGNIFKNVVKKHSRESWSLEIVTNRDIRKLYFCGNVKLSSFLKKEHGVDKIVFFLQLVGLSQYRIADK